MALLDAFRHRMRTDLAERFKVCGFPVFGVDGSRLELPRTESNERRFSPASTRGGNEAEDGTRSRGASRGVAPVRGRPATGGPAEKKANSPQMWLTTMFHVGTGLPWDWRTGPSDSSERDHLRQMIEALPADALVTADAGFVGYEYLEGAAGQRPALLDPGRGQRAAAEGVGLRRGEERPGLPVAGPRGRAPVNRRWCCAWWWRAAAGIRCIWSRRCGTNGGFRTQQVVGIYALRWGMELFYRHFKQTFERRKLRSHRGGQCRVGGDLVTAGAVGDGVCTPRWNAGGRGCRHDGSAWPDCCCVPIADRCANTRAIPTPGNRCASCCGRP